MIEENNQNNNEVTNHTSKFSKEEIEKGRTMSIVSYLSILVLIPYFSERNNKYVVFHAKQGMNLFIYEILLYAIDNIVSGFLPAIGFIAYIGLMFLFVLSILSIVYVINGEARELPILEKIKIIR